MPTALISGLIGQDGSHSAEFLLAKGYEVYGIIRRSSSFNTRRIDPIYEDPHVSHAGPRHAARLVFPAGTRPCARVLYSTVLGLRQG